jgi:hypothetical protein
MADSRLHRQRKGRMQCQIHELCCGVLGDSRIELSEWSCFEEAVQRCVVAEVGLSTIRRH